MPNWEYFDSAVVRLFCEIVWLRDNSQAYSKANAPADVQEPKRNLWKNIVIYLTITFSLIILALDSVCFNLYSRYPKRGMSHPALQITFIVYI